MLIFGKLNNILPFLRIKKLTIEAFGSVITFLSITAFSFFLLYFSFYSSKQIGLWDTVGAYGNWLSSVLTKFDFGHSVTTNRTVADILSSGIERTCILVTGGMSFVTIISWCIAWNSSGERKIKMYKWQLFLHLISAFPIFLVATIIRPYWVKWFSVLDQRDMDMHWYSTILSYAIPMIIIGVADLTLTNVLNTIYERLNATRRELFILAAKARNVKISRHIIRNMIVPVVSTISTQFAFLLGGSLVVEFIFFSDGLGIAGLDAIKNRDFMVIMGIVTVFSGLVVIFGFVDKFIQLIIDPRSLESRRIG